MLRATAARATDDWSSFASLMVTYVSSYVVVASGLVVGLAFISTPAVSLYDALMRVHDRRQCSRRSLRRRTYSAQVQFLARKALLLLMARTRLSIPDRPGGFESYRHGGWFMTTRVLRLVFSLSGLNLLAVALTLVWLHPEWLTWQRIVKTTTDVLNTDLGRLLPWASLVLVLALSARLRNTRVSRRYLEGQADAAFGLGVRLARVLETANHVAERNVKRFDDSLSKRLPTLLCREVTGYDLWELDGDRVMLSTKAGQMSYRPFTADRDPLVGYPAMADEDMEEFRAVLYELDRDPVWVAFVRLWPTLLYEISALRLHGGSGLGLDRSGTVLPDQRVVRQFLEQQVAEASVRLGPLIQDAKDDLQQLDRAVVTDSVLPPPTAAVRALIAELEVEVRAFQRDGRLFLGRCLVNIMCADSVGRAITRRLRTSRLLDTIDWAARK